jgi:hypothetical protein
MNIGSGSQVVPAVIEEVNSLTQLIRVCVLPAWPRLMIPDLSFFLQ